MCGISWCQAIKTPGGSETFKVSADASAPNNALDMVRSEYIYLDF